MRSQTIINLTFHGIGDAPESIGIDERDVWLSKDRVFEVLDVITPMTRVGITFDGGNKSDIETALPALIVRGTRRSGTSDRAAGLRRRWRCTRSSVAGCTGCCTLQQMSRART